MKRLPIVGLFFANSGDQKLFNLETEGVNVDAIFDRLDKQNICQCELIFGTTANRLLQKLQTYGDRMVIFHYAGHANEVKLEFEGTAGHANSLAQLFDIHAKQLKLVFLNGCSSRGQVKYLFKHNTSIEAVIATTKPISDSKAPKFAKYFYENLGNGKTIKAAFKAAVLSLNIASDEDIDKQVITRGFTFEEESFEFEWELHTRGKTILDWTLDKLQSNAAVQLKPIDLKKIEEFRKGIRKQERKIRRYKGDLEDAEDAEEKADINEDIESAEKKLKAFQAEIQKIKDQYLQNKDAIKLQNIEKAQSHLKKLNFVEQTDYLKDEILQTNSDNIAVLLHGGQQSALNLYKERFLMRNNINQDDKKIYLNFAGMVAERPNEENIWDKILDEFDFELDNPIAKNIAYKMIDLFCANDTPCNVVFIFDHVEENEPEDNLKIMETFWLELLTHVKAYMAEKNLTNLMSKIMLLMIDRRYHFEEDDYTLAKEKREEYDAILKDINHDEKDTIHLFPFVKKVQLRDFKDWERFTDIPLHELGLNTDFYKSFLGNDGAFMETAIIEVCKKLKVSHANVLPDL